MLKEICSTLTRTWQITSPWNFCWVWIISPENWKNCRFLKFSIVKSTFFVNLDTGPLFASFYRETFQKILIFLSYHKNCDFSKAPMQTFKWVIFPIWKKAWKSFQWNLFIFDCLHIDKVSSKYHRPIFRYEHWPLGMLILN